ncbi:MAG TPA: type II toxin-antitoxin system PemK/MazF family toxin [Dehalococcoidia bacterium]|nr:type II toxin-antitoxin system PemK/MazF family toxin [Dehalococcoidia bacterium]
MAVRRGEIYWVDFEPVKGSEQGGLRPALVVQNDAGNAASPTIIVAAMTRRVPPRRYPFVVVVSAIESGLNEVGAVNCAQLTTIQQAGPASRLMPARREDDSVQPIGRLGTESMAAVDAALRYNLGLR